MFDTELVEEAAQIARRIVSLSLRSGDECTWTVSTFDWARGGDPEPAPALDALYNGASGISLFLGEAWRCTGDTSFLACARRGMRYCERIGAEKPVRPGLYSGAVGVALAAARIAELTGDDEWARIAEWRLQGLEKLIQADAAYDAIGGAAGAILGLLRIGRTAAASDTLELALRFGEHLEGAARRTPIGWSWASGTATTRQDLCGYAHGASGMAHAFLELYAATGDTRWRFAASRAMAYERFHELEHSGDWPDYRELEVMKAIKGQGRPQLRARLQAGEPLPRRHQGPSRAWCHGAPGIALARVRALTLGVDAPEVEQELDRALRTTQRSLAVGIDQGHSLCHGAFGNAESLLTARERLGIDDSGAIASTVETALSRYANSKRQWPTGTMGRGYEPSLLVGEAGIGLFLLRAARTGAASALCVTDWRGLDRGDAIATDEAHRAQELARLLPLTHRAIRESGSTLAREQIAMHASASTDFTVAVAKIREMTHHDTSPGGDMQRDALQVDAALLDEQLAFTDYIDQLYHELSKPDAWAADWSTVRVQLARHARVIRTRWTWREAVSADVGAPPEDEDIVLIYRSGSSVVRKALTPLQGLIFEVMVHPVEFDKVVASVMTSVDADSSVTADLPAFIDEIVREAVSAGLVEIRSRASD